MLSSGIRGEWEVERGGGMWEGDGTVWCMYDWVCVAQIACFPLIHLYELALEKEYSKLARYYFPVGEL